MQRSLQDYSRYELSSKDKKENYALSLAVSVGVGMLFYDSMLFSLLIFCVTPFFEDIYASFLNEKRKTAMMFEFKDVLYTISASIASGRQLPTALSDAAKAEKMILGDESLLYPELSYIYSRYKDRNSEIEIMLEDLGKRTGIEEIKLFAHSCNICRQTGGDMEDVCLKSAFMLIEKIDYMKETQALLAEKKMDLLILVIIPPVVLFFLNISAYEYVRILYEGFAGRAVMSTALVLMAVSLIWSLKIMNLRL